MENFKDTKLLDMFCNLKLLKERSSEIKNKSKELFCVLIFAPV